MSIIDEMIPPPSMNFVGDGDFKSLGEQFLRMFIELGGLKPHHRVLDVGCGIGRMAIPLTQYLNGQGKYEGFDIVPTGIEWCQKQISARYPHFHFQLADVVNRLYNPAGQGSAASYKFSYPDESFDFVFLTSIFTHMLPDVLENYVSEISRVLVDGGKCFATVFLLNEQSESCLKAGLASIEFPHQVGKVRVKAVDVPEHAVAYPESLIQRLYSKYNLSIRQPIYYGSWCGREEYTSAHDIIVATKHKKPSLVRAIGRSLGLENLLRPRLN